MKGKQPKEEVLAFWPLSCTSPTVPSDLGDGAAGRTLLHRVTGTAWPQWGGLSQPLAGSPFGLLQHLGGIQGREVGLGPVEPAREVVAHGVLAPLVEDLELEGLLTGPKGRGP